MGIKHGARWALSWFSSTILDDIQHQVIFFTAFATMVCCVSKLTDRDMGIAPTMITVVGTVVSLVVSFKTNSAYSRWWEGRNLWASLTTSSRQLAMLIWLHVPNTPPPPKDDKADKDTDEKDKDKKQKKKDGKKKSKRMDRDGNASRRGSGETFDERRRASGDNTSTPLAKDKDAAVHFDQQIPGAQGYAESGDPHETLLPSPTSHSTSMQRQQQQQQQQQQTSLGAFNANAGAKRAPVEEDGDGKTSASEDDGPSQRGRSLRNKPYKLEPLRDSPAASRSVSRNDWNRTEKDRTTPNTSKSAFSRKSTASTTLSKLIKKETDKDEEEMSVALDGMLEKKTYIGLVQAFGVSMKHALRGESGPFYSDLYDLIAWLPKYNTSAMPPVTREDLLVPWINGIPRQKALYDDDSIAVPLTVPAPFTGYAFDSEHLSATRSNEKGPQHHGTGASKPDAAPKAAAKTSYPPDHRNTVSGRRPSIVHVPASGPTTAAATTSYDPIAGLPISTVSYPNAAATSTSDPEKTVQSWSTTSSAFRAQAITSATSYMRSGAESHHHAFARLDKHHRVQRKSEDVKSGKAHITSVELMPPRHPPMAQYWDFFPPLRVAKIVVDWIRKREKVLQQERVRGGRRKRGGGMRSEIPQEVLMYLTAYVNTLIQTGRINTTIVSPIMTALFELQKCMTDLEKIASTPIPSAYSFHLRLTVWAYLLFLPFQIYPLLGWNTIPAVAIAAITYLGFLEIGCQIEMPFGYDHSDLDLDKFTLKIARQLAEFPTALPPGKIMLSNLNRPLLPTLSHSVPDLLGVREAKPRATPLGFEASYKSDSEVEDAKEKGKKGAGSDTSQSSSSGEDSDSETGSDPDSASSGSASSSTSSANPAPRKDKKGKKDQAPKKPLPKNVRDVESALVANWHHVSGETEAFIGKPRHQLENRTGMEVAVMTL